MHIPIVNIPTLNSDKLNLAMIQYGKMLRNRKTFAEIEQIELDYLNTYKPLPKIEQRSILTKTQDEMSEQEIKDSLSNNEDLLKLLDDVTKENEEVVVDIKIQSDYEKRYDTTTGISDVVSKLENTEPYEQDTKQKPENKFEEPQTIKYKGNILETSKTNLVVQRSSQGYLFKEVEQETKSQYPETDNGMFYEDEAFDNEEEFEQPEQESEYTEDEDVFDEDVFDADDEEYDPFDDEETDDEETGIEKPQEEPEEEPEENSDDIFDEEPEDEDSDFDSDGEDEGIDVDEIEIVQEKYEEEKPKSISTKSKPISAIGRNPYKQVFTKVKTTKSDNSEKIDKSKPLVNIPKPIEKTKRMGVLDRLKDDYINRAEVIPREVKSFVSKYRGIKYSDAKTYISSRELDRALKQGIIILKNNRLW